LGWPGTDKSYLDKLFANIKQHSNFDKSPVQNCFVIKVRQPGRQKWFPPCRLLTSRPDRFIFDNGQHYAGDVTYSVDGFLEKNKDLLYPDAIRMLSSSKSKLLRSLFERYAAATMEPARQGDGPSLTPPSNPQPADRPAQRHVAPEGQQKATAYRGHPVPQPDAVAHG